MIRKKKKKTFSFILYGDNTADLVMSGTAFDIVTAVSICVRMAYEDIMNNSPTAAKSFKEIIQHAIADNGCPIWDIGTADAGNKK